MNKTPRRKSQAGPGSGHVVRGCLQNPRRLLGGGGETYESVCVRGHKKKKKGIKIRGGRERELQCGRTRCGEPTTKAKLLPRPRTFSLFYESQAWPALEVSITIVGPAVGS